MNRFLFFPILLLLSSCFSEPSKENKEVHSVKQVSTDSYELSIPAKQEALLILFPCFPCDAANTKAEFLIDEIALKNNVAVLYMNFNLHLWLSENEKIDLERILISAIEQNNINNNNTFIGGFSGGGNVSLLLSNYLKSKESTIQPKGVFIVDSPIDLLGLYENAQKNIEKNFSEVAVQEANWIVELFDTELGIGDSSLSHYENKSPYISKSHTLKNVSHLKDVKIRLYSEPDTLWWKTNRLAEYEDMNAYYIEQLAIELGELYGKKHINYIKTENKGYRKNGERHPHSWSIVDPEDLIEWILKSN